MTLNQLRNVIAIADTGSMNEAAKQLYIAQPSLSQSVKELEKEIGAELFRRGNRGVVLTLEGEEFLSYARQVIEQQAQRVLQPETRPRRTSVSLQSLMDEEVAEKGRNRANSVREEILRGRQKSEPQAHQKENTPSQLDNTKK